MTRVHLPSATRTDQLLQSALKVAQRDGYLNMRRDAIAEMAGVNGALVSVRLGTMQQVRRDVMRLAVRTECLPVIAQGLAIQDPHALKAPLELRQKAAASITGV